MTKGFNLPVEMNVPIEIEQKANKDVAKDIAYTFEKQRKIAKEYNSPRGTNIRRVAEYLWQHHQEILSYEQISKALEISEASSKINISNLNFYEGFPMTWIPVPKKKGFIQGSLNNYNDYESWDIKKQRTISSMVQVKDKAETISEGKRKQRQKVIVSQKEKNEISNL